MQNTATRTKEKQKVVPYDLSALETEYAECLQAEKEIAARKSLVVEFVKGKLEESGAESLGRFSLQRRVTLSWRTDDIVALFPKKFMAFLKPDPALLRIEMTDEPKLGKLAMVKETTAIIYKA